MKSGERVIRYIACADFKCGECDGYILKGKPYLLDMIPYGNGVFYNHKIHEWHWKGSPRVIIDRTRYISRSHIFHTDGDIRANKKRLFLAKVQPWRDW